jgi:C1A family cysteine protease
MPCFSNFALKQSNQKIMPIRIDPDKGGFAPNNNPGGGRRSSGIGGGGGGGGMLIYFLPQVLGFFFKRPKLLVVVLLIAGVVWYMRGGCSSDPADNTANSSAYSQGCDMDQKIYDEVQVYEPLANNVSNPMPEKISLLDYAPQRRNQGKQGSCVAWASSYAARTIMYSKQTGKSPDQVAFSPSFLYNQIALEDCQGAYLKYAMDALKEKGDLPLSQFPYDESSCDRKPNNTDLNGASPYKTKGANRLSMDGDDYRVNMLAIKQNLAAGAPVVIGMKVGGTFMNEMEGKDTWVPSQDDYDMNGFGGHAMCVIGYDDYKEGGSFQIMNSWGKEWGNNGVCWVRYSDFDHFVMEAYGLNPMGDVAKPAPTVFTASFGLENQDTKQAIPFVQKNGNLFATQSPVKKGKAGTPFKINFTNTVACYVYLIGLETNNTTYVLFPYTAKHSPYCGVTGTRLFPKDHTLFPDDVGTNDQMAVIITNEPVDYNALNSSISSAAGANLAEKINTALAGKLSTQVTYSKDANGNVNISKPVSDNGYAAAVLDIQKQ